MAPTVAVLGSLHLDVVVHAPRQPRLGETLPGTAWRPTPGGKGLNQAVHAAVHGADVCMFGRVGTDLFAPMLRDWAQSHGVDMTGVLASSDAGSGMSVAVIEETGDYAAVIVSGANQQLGADDVAAIEAAQPDLLVLQYEVNPEVLAPAARAVRASGGRVILNAAPAAHAPDGLLDAVDLLVVNEIEAEMLTGIAASERQTAERAVQALCGKVPAAILTLGPRGLLIGGADMPPTAIPGHAVVVADTHGAGDALIGALAARIGQGDDLMTAARYANAAAALMVSNAGADPTAAAPERVRALLPG